MMPRSYRSNATMPSETGASEKQEKIVLLRKCRNYIRALTLSREVLNIKVHHLTVGPLTSTLDVAQAHETVAGVLDDILHQLVSSTDEELKAKYKDESASHYLSAYEIKRDELDTYNPVTMEAWRVYQDRIA